MSYIPSCTQNIHRCSMPAMLQALVPLSSINRVSEVKKFRVRGYCSDICALSHLLTGYRMKPTPMALMQRWYSLVREKRAPRQDFLKSLVRVFDMDISTSSQVKYRGQVLIKNSSYFCRMMSNSPDIWRRISPCSNTKLKRK